MQVITDGRVEKVFMIIQSKRSCFSPSRKDAKEISTYVTQFIGLFLFLTIGSLTLSSCSSELSDDPIPYQPFSDILINLNLPEYSNLNHDGGYMDIDDGGVRGIILYRQNSSTYFAYERNCSYQPNEACATVETHVSGLYMFDPCCSSSFNFTTGQPVGGPAWRPLRKYFVELDGSNLTIMDEVLE